MAFRSTRPRAALPPPPSKAESVLTVPDALLDWGREPSRVVDWPRDWAAEVRELAAHSENGALDEKLTQQLLSRLEALVVEAIRAGRSDLLVGLDVQTMEWLGLAVAFESGADTVTIGRAGTFSWSEVRVLHEAWEHAVLAKRLREEGSGGEGHLDPESLQAATAKVARVMNAIREEWEDLDARISSVAPSEEHTCVSCEGALGVTSVELEGDLRYCGHCWSERIDLPAKRAEAMLLEQRRRAEALAAAAAARRAKAN